MHTRKRAHTQPHFWKQAVLLPSVWLGDISHTIPLSANNSIYTLTASFFFISFKGVGVLFSSKRRPEHVTVSCFWEWGSQLWQVCVCVCECAMGVQCLFSSVGGSPVDFSWSRATIRANKPVTVFLPLCSSSSSSSVWSRDKKKVGRCYHTKFQLKTVPVDCPVLFLWMVSQSLQLWICVYPVSTSASV